jgi:nucleoside-diphosphate-sugar epimerase
VKVGILGCGYSGVRLAERLVRDGHDARGSVRSEEKRTALERRGIDARVADLADADSLRAFAQGLDALVHLAPPPAVEEVHDEVDRLQAALPECVERVVYGSTTGVFGRVDGWIDERTPPGPRAARGEKRARYEEALAATGRPTRIVRIAGIYGPGRTTKHAIDRGLVLFEGGPPTSRVHVADLARILAAMLRDDAPELVIACDDAPAPTLEVARYVLGCLDEPMPPVLTREEAEAQMSPAAREMRLGGRRCRSVERSGLIGDLTYPTYRQGMKAALIEDGLLAPDE